jgi:argininosuccinate lyase
MSRFDSERDDLFHAINASIGFDRRLAPYDLLQSQAHARALHALGVLDDAELDAILGALEKIHQEVESGAFEYRAEDEDIHMAIERRLTEDLGELGGKLHTARSRNDQVATDLSLFVRAHSLACGDLTWQLMQTLLDKAIAHEGWRSPAYTHLQRAQPIYLSHYLLAYFWMFRRDLLRFRSAAQSASEMPSGSGALAGLNWDLDRDQMAATLGFTGPMQNSLDAVSSRDQALDLLSATAICSSHLSRLGSEIVIWSSSEFGYLSTDDSFASGSSIMPQKKNPDAAELLRGKAPRVAADLQALLGALHALPLGYSKDMQEDKEPLFDAVDTTETSLRVAARMMEGITFDRGRLEAAAEDRFLAATDLADVLTAEGVPFRAAHGIVGGLVRRALEEGRPFEEMYGEALSDLPPEARSRVEEAMSGRDVIDSKISAGGTGASRVAEQIATAKQELEALQPSPRD